MCNVNDIYVCSATHVRMHGRRHAYVLCMCICIMYEAMYVSMFEYNLVCSY